MLYNVLLYFNMRMIYSIFIHIELWNTYTFNNELNDERTFLFSCFLSSHFLQRPPTNVCSAIHHLDAIIFEEWNRNINWVLSKCSEFDIAVDWAEFLFSNENTSELNNMPVIIIRKNSKISKTNSVEKLFLGRVKERERERQRKKNDKWAEKKLLLGENSLHAFDWTVY